MKQHQISFYRTCPVSPVLIFETEYNVDKKSKRLLPKIIKILSKKERSYHQFPILDNY